MASQQGSASSVTIRSLTTHDDLRACEEIQRLTWNMVERDIVPMHLLVAVNLHGGLVLGAEVEGRLVGFLFGYPGWLPPDDPRREGLDVPFFHASQMLGVLPEYQDRGIGYLLKLKQREMALEQGFRLIMWTYDPLLSRNAHFNITRLGAISRRYLRNLYDELPGLNAGLPTDRLEVEWWIASRRVREHVAGAASRRLSGERPINPSTPRPDGLRAPAVAFSLPDELRMLVEIPGDFQALKAADMGLAQAWRAHIREVLEAAFAAGYVITGFTSQVEEGVRRSYYILTQGIDLTALARGGQNEG